MNVWPVRFATRSFEVERKFTLGMRKAATYVNKGGKAQGEEGTSALNVTRDLSA